MSKHEQLHQVQAAVYVRVSTTKESQRDSPEHQLGICREKTRLLDFDQPDELVYEDRDTGTSIIDRPAIRQLMDDAKQGVFQAVLFASLSRFSRDMMDSLMLKRLLVDSLGIRLISIDENFDSFIDNDEFKFQIFAAVNQKQSELISLSSRRGLRQSGLKGNFTGSLAPYGYRKVTVNGRKTLTPDPEKKEVVREIFRLYTEHQFGEKAIVQYLNERAIPSPKRGLWGITTVQRMLQNAVYTGVTFFSKYEIIKVHQLNNLHHRKKRLVERDRALWEQSMMGATHEPIIEEEVFERAQQIRYQRSGGRRGGVRRKVNVFAGYMTCKECGSAMVNMKSNHKSGGSYRYLVCSKRRRQGEAGCSNGYYLSYDAFYQAIRERLSSMMRQLASVEELLEYYRQKEGEYNPSALWGSRLKEEHALQAKIDRYREALYLLRKSKLEGNMDAKQYAYEKQRFEEELRLCELQWEQGQQPAADHEEQGSLEADIHRKLEGLLRFDLQQWASTEEAERLIRHWIERITVDRCGHVEVYATYQRPCALQNTSRM
ncbi:recombinase family protein [Paenibacillus sp. 1001270B_150601_E10]|uniref:recombinase family protein n=1 Tax=Paenibacillus sp. 1001270B_150601_E10 TaxID=2787079 RepID=UPI0018A01E84|nr:recombinase family protein [Paenibacillus sp. 1001270B_150601_E10]